MAARKVVYGYVDETGDRGVSARSSRFFAMAGIVVAEESDPLLRVAVDRCKTALKVPPNKTLHWKDHIKTYGRRQMVAEEVATLPLIVNYVIFEKAAIPTTYSMYGDHAIFYNYAARLMIERLLYTAHSWPGGSRDLVVKFGHVKGFGDHSETKTYLEKKRAQGGKLGSSVPWLLLRGNVNFASMGQYDGLQAADQYGGILKAAITPDEFGGYEPHHLLKIKHQIRRHNGTCWGAGFKVIALPGTMENLPWWPDGGL